MVIRQLRAAADVAFAGLPVSQSLAGYLLADAAEHVDVPRMNEFHSDRPPLAEIKPVVESAYDPIQTLHI